MKLTDWTTGEPVEREYRRLPLWPTVWRAVRARVRYWWLRARGR